MTATDFKKWLAIGTGIGIEIGRQDLMITAVRVRPSGVTVLGELTIHRFREQPAAEWGADYASFLKKVGLTHLAATVLLPRDEVMVRQLALPGVVDRDLAAQTVGSPHAAWRLSNSPALQRALTNRYLGSLGLPSLRK